MTLHETKFSGKKDEYAAGGTRDSRAGKGRFDLTTPFLEKRLAGVYERGAANHGDRQWELGLPFSRCLDSAKRHINQFQQGMIDEDHLAQSIWNLACIIHFQETGRTELDDLPKYVIPSSQI